MTFIIPVSKIEFLGLLIDFYFSLILRFATQAKSKKRSIYMNSTERYNTDLQRILQMLNGIQPYDKDIDLKKRGKRLVGKECHPIRKS